jgi:hypothetical protein
MKSLLTLILCVTGAALLQAAPTPTPEMTIQYALSKDPKTWVMADSLTNGPIGEVVDYTSEWVPKGDDIENWKEMFDVKTMLTSDTIAHHIESWKTFLSQVDPKAEVNVQTNEDGSSLVTYKSIVADEMGISRYFKGKDGIYVISYRMRPSAKKDERLKIWQGILSSATLVKNEKKGKA